MSASSSATVTLMRLYRGVALLLLNTIVLFAAVNALLCGYYWIRDARSVGNQHLYSMHFNPESYTRISRETATAVGLEFDRMGEQQSYQFHPWTGFIEGGFRGEFVNVSDAGIRNTVADPPPAGEHESFVVWMFGGSTMLGWGMPDAETIPSHFQHALQRLMREKRVDVVNQGHAYYTSMQELALLLSELRRSAPSPQLVVVLDGLNDAIVNARGEVLPRFSEIAHGGWINEKAQHQWARQLSWGARLAWFEPTVAFPMLRLADAIRGGGGAAPRLGGVSEGPVENRLVDKAMRDPVTVAVRNYRTNRMLIDAAARAAGARAVQFLQPVPGIGTYRTKVGSLDRTGLQFYSQLRAPGGDPLGHDISDAILDLEHPFVDHDHYSDAGCLAVATRMAEIVARELRVSPP